MTRHYLWLVAALAALWLTSCGAGTTLTGMAGDTLTPAPIGETGGLPSFPVESGPRTAAATGDSITLLGSDYIQKRNATDDGDALVIGPTTSNDGTAYGLYRFSGLNGMSPHTLTVNAIPGELEQRYFVGLADFSELRWRWWGPVTIPEFQLNFEGDYNRYISALGNMYMVVVTHGANVTRHESSTLTFGASGPDDPTNPGAPTNLHASDGTYAEKVMLEWTAGEGAEWYRVFRKVEENSAGSQEWIFIGESETTSFADLNCENDHVYYYKVNSARMGNNGQILYSGFSNIDSGYCHSQGGGGELDAPTGLVATDGTYADKVRLEWNASTGAGWYRIYRLASPSGSDWTFLGESQMPSYNDMNVEPGHVYAYKVQAAAQGSGGIIYSGFSNTDTGYASGNGGGGELDAPTGLVATDGTYTDKVKLEWQAVTGAGWYKIYRSLNAGAQQWQVIGESQTNFYADMQVEPGVVYIYKVQAAAQGNDGTIHYSDYSNTDTGYAGDGNNGGGLDTPQNLVATDGTYTDKVRVEWGAVTGASFYKLYRRVDGSANDYAFYAECQTNSFDDFQVEPGFFFLYKVKAVGYDGNGNTIWSDFSNSDSGFVGDGGNPGAP